MIGFVHTDGAVVIADVTDEGVLYELCKLPDGSGRFRMHDVDANQPITIITAPFKQAQAKFDDIVGKVNSMTCVHEWGDGWLLCVNKVEQYRVCYKCLTREFRKLKMSKDDE